TKPVDNLATSIFKVHYNLCLHCKMEDITNMKMDYNIREGFWSTYPVFTFELILDPSETFEKHEEPGLNDDQLAENTLDLEDYVTCNQKLTEAGCSEDIEIANES
ncbi:hypothetical protein L9F63_017404, partial [Diploptera punctata]